MDVFSHNPQLVLVPPSFLYITCPDDARMIIRPSHPLAILARHKNRFGGMVLLHDAPSSIIRPYPMRRSNIKFSLMWLSTALDHRGVMFALPFCLNPPIAFL